MDCWLRELFQQKLNSSGGLLRNGEMLETREIGASREIAQRSALHRRDFIIYLFETSLAETLVGLQVEIKVTSIQCDPIPSSSISKVSRIVSIQQILI